MLWRHCGTALSSQELEADFAVPGLHAQKAAVLATRGAVVHGRQGQELPFSALAAYPVRGLDSGSSLTRVFVDPHGQPEQPGEQAARQVDRLVMQPHLCQRPASPGRTSDPPATPRGDWISTLHFHKPTSSLRHV